MADRPPTTVQTVILAKATFATAARARTWVARHGFKTKIGGKGPDETDTSWRFRQRDPGDFVEGSLRTIDMTTGVQAVVGRLRKGR